MHVEVVRRGFKVGLVPLVKKFKLFFGDRVVPNGIQQVNEFRIMLTVDLLQFQEIHVEGIEDLGAIKIGRLVKRAEGGSFLPGDDRWKLVEIADKDNIPPTSQIWL
jgi:hypothetical protein